MSPDVEPAAALAAPPAALPIDADTIVRTFHSGHPRVPLADLSVRQADDGAPLVVVSGTGPVAEVRRAAQATTLAFWPVGAMDPDVPRRPEILPIPPPPAAPAPPTITDAAGRALGELRRATDRLSDRMDAVGKLLEQPLALGGDLLTDFQTMRGTVSAVQHLADATTDLERALAAVPLDALRDHVAQGRGHATAPPDPLRRPTPPAGPSTIERLADDVEAAVKDGRGLLRVVADSRERLRARLRAILTEHLPALAVTIEQAEQALRQDIAALVDHAATTGQVRRSADRLMADAVHGFPMLHHRRADVVELRRILEALLA